MRLNLFKDGFPLSLFLFNASLLHYDYSFFYEIGMEEVGIVYLFIYIIITFVLLLNMLIALLSNVYIKISKKSSHYYFDRIVNYRVMFLND